MGKVTSINPSTEEVYGELEESSASEINQKVKVARENHEWGKKKIEERVEVVRRLIDLLDSKKEELVRVMAMEMGKPLKAGRHEISIAQKRIFDYCAMIPSFISDEILFEDVKEKNIIVLLKTKNKPGKTFNYKFTYLEKSGAEYLVSKKVKAVGLDSLSIERNQPDYNTHKILLKNNIPIFEGLYLGKIKQGKYLFYGFPLKIKADGSPIRAVLIKP